MDCWLFSSGEPCFQGQPILYFMNHYAFTLPLQGYVQTPFILILLSPPGGDLIQVLPAVSFGSANATAELPGKGLDG